ncbi:helix-turn-helix domain-containing protein [Bacillus toyonensis]|uniref:helix-turn-helix domain-containing protein n=1 Tax=Bacillus toyonensis TaxID=155322 RepID=UPI0011A7FA9F|nr:helix-turn-helix transcriptional regulator [Bacillus toyonensis]
MSRYSEILKEYIEKSNLSLSEIENELRKKGFNKNKSYLSNLQNGKVEAPSVEVNIALAETIGADPIRFVLTPLIGHIKQNKKTNENNIVKDYSNMMFSFISTIFDMYKDEFYHYVVTNFDETIELDLIHRFNYEDMKSMFEKEITEEEFIQMVFPFDLQKKTDGETEESLVEITSDEEQYLLECLKLYRKMQLKPKN